MADFTTEAVLQAYDGQLWAGPADTPVPADREVALDSAFVSCGWLTEDGVKFNPNLTSEDAIKGWPRGTVLLKPAATLEPEFTFALAQHDSDTLDWVIDPSATRVLVLDYKATRTGEQHRLVLPRVKIANASEMSFNHSDLVATEITVSCEHDSTATYTFAFLLPSSDGLTTITKSY